MGENYLTMLEIDIKYILEGKHINDIILTDQDITWVQIGQQQVLVGSYFAGFISMPFYFQIEPIVLGILWFYQN